MRRYDKKISMKKANILFEQRCNEIKFNWNGKYANEETISLGGDIESVDEDDTIDDESTQFFSDVDGERLVDNDLNS